MFSHFSASFSSFHMWHFLCFLEALLILTGVFFCSLIPPRASFCLASPEILAPRNCILMTIIYLDMNIFYIAKHVKTFYLKIPLFKKYHKKVFFYSRERKKNSKVLPQKEYTIIKFLKISHKFFSFSINTQSLVKFLYLETAAWMAKGSDILLVVTMFSLSKV